MQSFLPSNEACDFKFYYYPNTSETGGQQAAIIYPSVILLLYTRKMYRKFFSMRKRPKNLITETSNFQTHFEQK